MENIRIHIETCKATFKPSETEMLDLCGKYSNQLNKTQKKIRRKINKKPNAR